MALSITNTDMIAAAGDGMNAEQLLAQARYRSRVRRSSIHRGDHCPKHPVAEVLTPEGFDMYRAGYNACFLRQTEIVQQARIDLSRSRAAHERALSRARKAETTAKNLGALVGIERYIEGPTLENILSRVCWLTGIAKQDVVSHRRTKAMTLPRAMFFHLARSHTTRSLPQIASYLGGRDHTTALHHVRRWNARKAEVRAKRRKVTA